MASEHPKAFNRGKLYTVTPKQLRLLLAAVFLLIFAGCKHPEDLVPEQHPEPWTPSEVENLLGGNDPIEPFNRCMFACTDFGMNYIADPLGRIYTTIFPKPFIDHLQNVCTNLEFPAHAISCLLQKEWGGAGDDSLRFLINTTLGVAGIFDAAEYFWHIPPSRADFGQAFAKWGIGPGETFLLPFVPSVNRRDLTGLIFDTAFDIKTYIPYAGYATALNQIALMEESYRQIAGDALDPYKNYRQSFLLYRELSLRLWFYREAKRQIAAYLAKKAAGKLSGKKALSPAMAKPEWVLGNWIGLDDYYSQGALIDSIRSVMVKPEKSNDFWYMHLSLFNSDFVKRASMRKLQIAPGRPKLVYAYWQPDKTAAAKFSKTRLLLLLPGIGSRSTCNMAAAIAEKFCQAGYHVASFDSLFNWHFTIADNPVRLPGFLPDDAERVRKVLLEAFRDLQHSGKIPSGDKTPDVLLAGYSLGGLHTLKIAELEEQNPQLPIKGFLAVNPPVSSLWALKKINELLATSAGWTKTQMLNKLTRATGPVFLTLTRKYPAYNPKNSTLDPMRYQVPITLDEAPYLVGLNLKLDVRDLLFAAHREKPLPGIPPYNWGRRNAMYLALDKIALDEYAERFVMPQYPGRKPEELYHLCSLRSLEKSLKTNPKIRIYHSYDDILISEEERRWLDAALGSRISWVSNGGHLGYLYFEEVQKEFIKSVNAIK